MRGEHGARESARRTIPSRHPSSGAGSSIRVEDQSTIASSRALFVSDVVIERHRLDAEFASDVAHADRRQSAGVGYGDCRVDDLLPGQVRALRSYSLRPTFTDLRPWASIPSKTYRRKENGKEQQSSRSTARPGSSRSVISIDPNPGPTGTRPRCRRCGHLWGRPHPRRTLPRRFRRTLAAGLRLAAALTTRVGRSGLWHGGGARCQGRRVRRRRRGAG